MKFKIEKLGRKLCNISIYMVILTYIAIALWGDVERGNIFNNSLPLIVGLLGGWMGVLWASAKLKTGGNKRDNSSGTT